MPSSAFSAMESILGLVGLVKPASVLDIGVGFGKTGFLIREYFDLRPDKKKGYAGWSMQIDGIEIFEKYLTPVHDYIYDRIFIGNALEVLRENNLCYDMILALDILEHFRKDEGRAFIELCRGRSGCTVISTPYLYFRQGAEFNNPYETHLSGWDVRDFNDMGCSCLWRHGISLVAVFSEKKLDIRIDNAKDDEALTPGERGLAKGLIAMYLDTGQAAACIETCGKYLPFFGDDPELPLAMALSYEREKDAANACRRAHEALAIDGSLKAAKEIIRRCGG